MKSLFRHIVVVFLLISLASCDAVSTLLTKNQFEQFKDYNPFTLVIGEITWAMLTPEQQLDKINEYTNAALSDDSDDFFDELSDEDYKNYRDDVTDHYRELLDVVPNDEAETYLVDLALYQRRAMALGRIEVYTRSSHAVDGFENLYMSYYSGEEDGLLNKDVFIQKVFGRQDLIDDGESISEIRTDLDSDLIGAYYAGEAFNKLGETITNIDNPSAEVVTEADAVIILLSCLIYRIIDLSIDGEPSPTDIDDPAFVELRNYILDGTVLTSVVFPQDVTAEDIIAEGDTMLEHYLGKGGALIYTATGYELPPITVLEGGE